MNIRVIKDEALNELGESKWINLNVDKLSANGRRLKARSVQVIWDSIISGFDGILNMYLSNERNARSLVKVINVNSASNVNNSELFSIDADFRLLKFDYIKNSNIGGQLNISINYY